MVYTIIATLLGVSIALAPPIDIVIKNPPLMYWPWMILLFGFAGCLLVFLSTDLSIKILSVLSLLGCFFSSSPYISFTSYCVFVSCLYFYTLCRKIKNWEFVFQCFKAVFVLELILTVMQFLGHDSLLSFAQGKDHDCFLSMGQHMQASSFAAVLTAFLINRSGWFIVFLFVVGFFCHSSWTLLTAGVGSYILLYPKYNRIASSILILCAVGFMLYSVQCSKVEQFIHTSGRGPVWIESLQWSAKHPWTGWGIGTYKEIFPALERKGHMVYKTAHNSVVESIFEIGYPGTLIVFGMISVFIFILFWTKKIDAAAGLVIILMDSLAHFPERTAQTFVLIIMYLSYCRWRLDHGPNSQQSQNSQ